MKNQKLASILIFIISTHFFISCTRESADYTSTAKEIISQGTWVVDYYYAGQNKTAQFSNYQFSFIGNGTVTALNGGNSFSGTWSVVTDVNRNEVLKINLVQEPNLQELNNQWSVGDKTSLSVSMNVNGSELRFKKL